MITRLKYKCPFGTFKEYLDAVSQEFQNNKDLYNNIAIT